MTVNERFLAKAESLKPELIHETRNIQGNERELHTGDEAVFDFGNHYVGYLSVDLISLGHHQDAPLLLQLQFAEIKEELNSDPEEYHGWISPSWVQMEQIHVDVLPATLKLARRYAFRYVKIKVLAASDNYCVRVTGLSVDAVSSANYANVRRPDLSEKDRRIDDIALRTLHNCMQEVFEDGPKRDRRLWLGDLRLEALANYETFRNYDLVKRCLYLFAGSTLEEGRLASNIFITPKVECDFQTMFDYTLFYINVLWNYFEASGDMETLQDLEPVCLRQHELLQNCFAEDGLVDVEKAGMIFVDWDLQLDKQASGQAIYIYALRDLVKIEEALNKPTDQLKKEIEKCTKAALSLYDREKGLFISGKDKQVSYMSQIWMILAETVDKDAAKGILKKMTEYPQAAKPVSPYAYHHYVQAMINAGLKDEAYELMQSYWGSMAEKDTDTFWEIYDPENPAVSPYGGLVVHSFCHAWSCTPAYFLRRCFY